MASISTHRPHVWHIARPLVTDMIHWVLTPAREVDGIGVPYLHFTDEQTESGVSVSRHDPRPAAPPAEAPLPCLGGDLLLRAWVEACHSGYLRQRMLGSGGVEGSGQASHAGVVVRGLAVKPLLRLMCVESPVCAGLGPTPWPQQSRCGLYPLPLQSLAFPTGEGVVLSWEVFEVQFCCCFLGFSD